MKFHDYLLRFKLSEERDAYIDISSLLLYLEPFKLIKKCQNSRQITKESINYMNIWSISRLTEYKNLLQEAIIKEKERINGFFNFKNEEIRMKIEEINENSIIYQSSDKKELDFLEKEEVLKSCFRSLYKEITLLYEYDAINKNLLDHLHHKYKKFSEIPINSEIFSLNSSITEISQNKAKLEYIYSSTFSCDSPSTTLLLTELLSKNERYFFIFFSLCSFTLIIMILIMAFQGDLDPDKENAYFSEIFAMYRGLALFIGYMWLLAWNVYGWTISNIDYKRIFSFNEHYSHFNQILKRNACFTTIFLMTFIWYIINCEKTQKISSIFEWFPKDYCPLICWAFILIYMLFPSKRCFNGKGRCYFYRLFKDILCFSCFKQISFPMNWATDQLVSLIIPLCDFEYTICYYIKKISGSNTADCQEADILIIPFLAASIPLIYRMTQCLNANRNNNGYILAKKQDFFNFLKYLITFLTVCFSLSYNINSDLESLFICWILIAVISSVYSYSWDVKMDWGFFENNQRLLRKKLGFKRKYLYYIAISFNLLLRFAWIGSLSYGIIQSKLGMRKEVIILVVGGLEVYRRSVWNFIRFIKYNIFSRFTHFSIYLLFLHIFRYIYSFLHIFQYIYYVFKG